MQVKMDPRRPLTSNVFTTILEHSLSVDDDDAPQMIADALMAVLIMANVFGMEDPENFSAMAAAGQGNAAKAAEHFTGYADEG